MYIFIDIILLESGGDNLAADFSRELADYTVYVIDTAGGDKVPRKGGPGESCCVCVWERYCACVSNCDLKGFNVH